MLIKGSTVFESKMENISLPLTHLIRATVFGLLFLSGTCRVRSYDMHAYCGSKLYLDTLSGNQIKLEYNGYSYKSTCETTIRAWRAWSNPFDSLMFYFDHLDLDCSDGHLEFYKDEYNRLRVDGLETNVCGSSKPQGVFTVNSGSFRIVYVQRQFVQVNDMFSMIITAYGNTPCSSQLYECDNSRCIDADIACNDYDSCGDGSGCDKDTTAIIIGGTVGGVVSLLSIVSIVICCICCQRKHRKLQSPTSMTGTNTPQIKQATCLPVYHMNQGMAYPTGKEVYAVIPTNLPSTLLSTGQNIADPASATPVSTGPNFADRAGATASGDEEH